MFGRATRRAQSLRARRASPSSLLREHAVTLAALVIYAAGSLVMFGDVPWTSSQLTFSGGDVAQLVWALEWTPHALAHGLNPFLTNAVNVPFGVDLASNTSMSLLGIVAAPVTETLGPVAAYNLLVHLAFFISAASMFFVLRGRLASPLAALVGGLFYGFSPYMVGQGTEHLNLCFVAFLPIVADLALRGATGGLTPRRAGLWCGALAGLSFLVSAEPISELVLVIAICCVVFVLASPSRSLERLGAVVRTGVWALLPFAVICGFPIAMMLFGTNHLIAAPAEFELQSLRGDLLGPLLPSANQAIRLGPLGRTGERLVNGDYPESGAYLGALLVLVLIATILWRRRERVVLAAALGGLVAYLFSLGTRLNIDATVTAVPLPFALLTHIPFLRDESAIRYSVVLDLCAAVVLAYGVDAVVRSWYRSTAARGRNLVAAAGLLVVAALVLDLPQAPYPLVPSAVPSLFTTGEVGVLPPGSVLLSYPYPLWPDTEPLIWQASAAMRVRLLGGPFLTPQNAPDAGEGIPALLDPLTLEQLFAGALSGAPMSDTFGPDSLAGTLPPPDAATSAALRSFLRTYDVATVAIDPSINGAGLVRRYLARALGAEPVDLGGLELFMNVQRDLAAA